MSNWPRAFQESFFLLIAVLLQWIFVPYLAISRTIPDLLLIYLIMRSLHLEKPGLSVVLGFAGGFLFDWLSGEMVGLSSLIFSLAAFTAALAGRENEKLTKTHLLILGLSLLPLLLFLSSLLRLSGLDWKLIMLNSFVPSSLYDLAIYLFIIYFFSFKKKRKMI